MSNNTCPTRPLGDATNACASTAFVADSVNNVLPGGILPTSLGGTGTATPSLVAGTHMAVSGTWPDQNINTSLNNVIGRPLLDYYLNTDPDYSAAFQRAHDAVTETAGATVILLPPITMPVGSVAVTITKPVRFVGMGFTDLPPSNGGSVITRSSTALSPFLFRAGSAGAGFFRCEFNEAQPIPSSVVPTAWAPTPYPQFIDINGANGSIIFDDVMFRGVTKAINSYLSGRLRLNNIKAHCFNYLVRTDAAFDSDRYEQIHGWPYWADNLNVHAYTRANLDLIKLGRADTPYINSIFGIFANSIIRFFPGTSSGGGDTLVTSTRGKFSQIQSDTSQSAILIDAGCDSAELVVSALDFQGVDANNPPHTTAGSSAIKILSNNVRLRVGLRSQISDTVILVTGNTCVVDVDEAMIDQWGAQTPTAAAFDTSGGVSSIIRLSKASATTFYISRTMTNGNGIDLGPSKPNLLINGDFKINQRGYVSGAALTPGQYAHDRWLWGTAAANYTFVVNTDSSNTITLPAGGGILQRIASSLVVGGDYTLSANTGCFGRIDYTPPGLGSVYGTYAAMPLTLENIPAGSSIIVWVFNQTSSQPLLVQDVKLELGGNQTQFVSRSYELELLACQEYYWSYNPGNEYFYPIDTSGVFRALTVKFPRAMRIVPAVTVNAVSSGTFATSYPQAQSVTMQDACLRGDGAATGTNVYLVGFTATAEI